MAAQRITDNAMMAYARDPTAPLDPRLAAANPALFFKLRQAQLDAENQPANPPAVSAEQWQANQQAAADRARAAHALVQTQTQATERQMQIVQPDAEAASVHATNEASFRRELGAMIEAGQCNQARKAALDAGALEDAASVAKLCTAPQAPSRVVHRQRHGS